MVKYFYEEVGDTESRAQNIDFSFGRFIIRWLDNCADGLGEATELYCNDGPAICARFL